MTYTQGLSMSNTINVAQRIQQLQVEIQGLKNEAKKAQVKALKDKNWTHHASLIEKISKRNNEIATLKKGISSSQSNTSKKQDTSAVTQGLTREQIKAKIVEANTQAKNADSKMRTALKNKNQQQIKTYQQKRDAYNTESKRLQQLLNNPTTEKQTSSPSSANQNAQQAEKRKQIKAQIAKASEEAKAADANMRTALRNKQPDHATSHRKERDSHNAEVKRLQQLLKSTTTGSQTASSQPIEPLSASELAKYKKFPEVRKKRLNQLPFEIKHAKKMTDLYIKNKSDKRHEWNRKLKKLLAEKQLLQKLSTLDTKTKQGGTGSSTTAFSKEQIKAQIIKAKEKAKAADADMRTALRNQEPEHATAHREERDRYYEDAKRLQRLLTPLSATEQKEYALLQSRMKWWKSKGEHKNIQKNKARFDELSMRDKLTQKNSQSKQQASPTLSTATKLAYKTYGEAELKKYILATAHQVEQGQKIIFKLNNACKYTHSGYTCNWASSEKKIASSRENHITIDTDNLDEKEYRIQLAIYKGGQNVASGGAFFTVQQANLTGKTNKTEQQIIKEIATLKKQATAAQKNAQQEKDKNKQKVYWAENKRYMKDIKRLNAELDALKKKQGKSTGNKTLKPLNAQELKRYEQLKRSMDYWKKTAGQEKNIKKYQAEFNELEKRFKANQGKNPASQSGDFVTKTRKAYLGSDPTYPKPDVAHNPILVKLFFGYFSEKNAAINDPTHTEAYKRVRDPDATKTDKNKEGRTGFPLYVAENNTDLANLPKKVDFFVRDFLQVHGAGGRKGVKPDGSDDAPWVIGDKLQIKNNKIVINKQRNGLNISDGALNSKFQQKFDEYVEKINKGIPDKTKHLKGFKGVAHRDGIQLIPKEGSGSNKIRQLQGATMRNVVVNGNTIQSKADFQGIFATDGAFQNLTITNNRASFIPQLTLYE